MDKREMHRSIVDQTEILSAKGGTRDDRRQLGHAVERRLRSTERLCLREPKQRPIIRPR